MRLDNAVAADVLERILSAYGFTMQKEKSPLIIGLLIFVIILTCFSFSDLFPKFIKENYIMKYSLKALPCCIVWFRVIYELMTKDFEKDYKLD